MVEAPGAAEPKCYQQIDTPFRREFTTRDLNALLDRLAAQQTQALAA